MYLSIYLYYYVQWIVSSARATVVAVLCRAASTITTTTNYSVLVGLRFNSTVIPLPFFFFFFFFLWKDLFFIFFFLMERFIFYFLSFYFFLSHSFSLLVNQQHQLHTYIHTHTYPRALQSLLASSKRNPSSHSPPKNIPRFYYPNYSLPHTFLGLPYNYSVPCLL